MRSYLTDLSEQSGISSVDWPEIEFQNRHRLNQLKLALDLPEQVYQTYALPVVHNLIRYCHLLPASERHHHSEPGGLVRHSLEVAIHALRRSEAYLYGREGSPDIQDSLSLRWRLAIALAGLLHDVGKAITDINVIGKDNREQLWNPYRSGLWHWLQDERISSYLIIWQARRYGKHEIAAIFIARDLIGPATLEFIGEFGHGLTTTLFDSLAGTNREERFGLLIHDADKDSVSLDLRAHALSPGDGRGKDLYEIVLNLLQRPIVRGDWEANKCKCCFYRVSETIYIDWVKAYGLICKGAEEDGINPFSYDRDDLADVLIERGVAIASESNRGLLKRYVYYPITEGSPSVQFLRIAEVRWIIPSGVIPEYFHTLPTPDATLPPTSEQQETVGHLDGQQSSSIFPKDHEFHWISDLFMRNGPDSPFLHDGCICVPYPEGITSLGRNAAEDLKQLRSAGLILSDPQMPVRMVWEIGGRRGIKFNRSISATLATEFGLPSSGNPIDGDTLNTSVTAPQKNQRKTGFVPNRRTHRSKKPASATASFPQGFQDDLFNAERLQAISKVER